MPMLHGIIKSGLSVAWRMDSQGTVISFDPAGTAWSATTDRPLPGSGIVTDSGTSAQANEGGQAGQFGRDVMKGGQ